MQKFILSNQHEFLIYVLKRLNLVMELYKNRLRCHLPVYTEPPI